jgi:uncharacterized membrane protein
MSDTDIANAEAGPADTIVGISFTDAFRAQEFLTATMRLRAQHHIELLDAVTITKDLEGKTTARETVDPSPGRSALSGGMWAGLIGLILGGPIGWVAGAAVGAGVGAVTAKVVDLGIPDDWVGWFRDAVQPGTVTVVLLMRRADRAVVLSELERFEGARLVYANVESDMVQRIRDALGDPATGPLTQSASPTGSTLPPPSPSDAAGVPSDGERETR